jgi:hypothetical protein
MDLVLVPLWKRPGFARACLKRLSAAAAQYDGNLMFRLLLDEGYSPLVEKEAVDFATNENVFADVTVRPKRYGRGNSYNIMKALADASTGPWKRVHIVEEDIFVSDGYFDFHRRTHALAGDSVFAISACRNQNEPTPEPGAPHLRWWRYADDEKIPDEHWETVWRHTSYQSLGVSLPMDSVRAVVPHVTDKYFFDPVGYCRKYFPGSEIPAPHAEQDGVLNRLRERAGMSTVYPVAPRAYHAGFTGYNRAGVAAMDGSPAEQAEALLRMNSAELNSMASHEFRDHEVVPLHTLRPVRRMV